MSDDVLNKVTALFKQQNDQFNKRFDESDKRFDKLVALVFEHYNHFSQTVDRLEEKVDQTADNILTRVDGVFKEVLAMRQEQVHILGVMLEQMRL